MRSFFPKIIAIIICLTLMITAFSQLVSAIAPAIPDTSKAKYVSLYNVNTDKTVYSKNSGEKMFPGSSVKMMTGLIACEMLGTRLDEVVEITDELIKGAQGWNIKLKAGMRVTVKDLLYGVLCGCGNDATTAIATLCSGGVNSFVEYMNIKAESLGMKNTHFTNPTGIDDSLMYSTLSDIMIIAKEVCKNQLYLDISSTMSYVYTPLDTDEEIKFFNRNALISNFYSLGYRNLYAYGLIAGKTELGGQCAITYAEKNGTSYICAVMNAEESDDTIYSYEIINSLLDYAFDNYSYVRIAEKGTYVCDTNVKFAMPSSNDENVMVSCVIKDDVYTLTQQDINPEKDLVYRHFLHKEALKAPVSQGTIVGGIDIIYNGEIVGSAILVAGKSIESSNTLIRLDKLRSFFMGRFFILSISFFIIGILIYKRVLILKLRKNKNRKKNVKKFYQ